MVGVSSKSREKKNFIVVRICSPSAFKPKDEIVRCERRGGEGRGNAGFSQKKSKRGGGDRELVKLNPFMKKKKKKKK